MLWLDVPVDSVSFLASALSDFTTQHGVSAREDVIVGLQVEPLGPLICLVTSNWTDDDGSVVIADASMLTAMSMRELFPGTSRQWSDRLVELVEAGIAVLELRPLKQEKEPSSQAKAQMKSTGGRWRLRVGINWREYMSECAWKPSFAPNSRLSLHQSMRDVMLWALMNSQDLVGQWTYPYPKELGVLYSAVTNAEEDSVSAPSTKFDISDIHSRIDVSRQLQRDTTELARDDRLLPTLRPYQKAAVSWMLERERDASLSPTTASIVSYVTFTGNASVQYDPLQACFFSDGRTHYSMQSAIPLEFVLSGVRGGILADEMGLGKTVEVIALILSHQHDRDKPRMTSEYAPMDTTELAKDGDAVKSCVCGSSVEHALGWVQCDYCSSLHHQLCTGYDKARGGFVFLLPDTSGNETWVSSDSFMCFACQSEMCPELGSKATLIVSPEAIQAQWEHEFTRHVKPGALSVLRYPGVKAIRSRFASKRARKPSA